MAERTIKTYRFQNLDCASCAARIEHAVASLPMVKRASLDFLRNRFTVALDQTTDNAHAWLVVEQTITKVEPSVQLVAREEDDRDGRVSAIPKIPLVRIIFAVSLFIASYMTWDPISIVVLIVAFLAVGLPVLVKAIAGVTRKHVWNEHVLMSVATIGAWVIGAYHEAVAVMLFYQVGEFFQELAVRRSRASISSLMGIQSKIAHVVRDGHVIDIACEDVSVGDELVIKTGELVPVDATLLSGTTMLDTRALTGESEPRFVQPGAILLSGAINIGNPVRATATRRYEDSTVRKILDLVEQSASRKANSEQFITRFSRYYTPSVAIGALLIALIPQFIYPQIDWVYRALVFLVVSCPCALVVSIPMGFFGGIGGSARLGVLVKGGNYLAALGRVKTVVFDKTGTITYGRPQVTGCMIHADDSYDEQAILRLSASIERYSTHPAAQAVVAAYKGDLADAFEIIEKAGYGIEGIVEGHFVVVGNALYLNSFGIAPSYDEKTGMYLYVAIDGEHIATLSLSDIVKPEAVEAISDMKKLGIEHTVLISGDTQETARTVAGSIGIHEAHGTMLPDQKVAFVDHLLTARETYGTLAFVGDGINDAPVLARADIGIAMGAMGSDAAIEAADVVVMNDNLIRIGQSIEIAKKTLSVVRQNIVLALGIKFLVLILGAFGSVSMWLAVFADTGVALLAILNSLRPLRFAGRFTSKTSCSIRQHGQ